MRPRSLASALGDEGSRYFQVYALVWGFLGGRQGGEELHVLHMLLVPCALGGVFAQRTHGTNYYVVYPGNTSEYHPPTEACMINSKQHRGCRIQDPETRGKN